MRKPQYLRYRRILMIVKASLMTINLLNRLKSWDVSDLRSPRISSKKLS